MPVFISHSHQDKDFVDNLATHLIKRNAHVWVDRWEIKVGESILGKVQNVIAGASAVLFVLSNFKSLHPMPMDANDRPTASDPRFSRRIGSERIASPSVCSRRLESRCHCPGRSSC